VSYTIIVHFARLHHFFRNLVTSGSRVFSTQVSGRSARERSHVRRGQMAMRYVFSFCWRESGSRSVSVRNLSSLDWICSLMLSMDGVA